jgi:hypothetical protein
MHGYLYAAVTAIFAVQPTRGADFPKEHLGSGQPILANNFTDKNRCVTPSKDLRQEYILCVSAGLDGTLAEANMLPTQPAWLRKRDVRSQMLCTATPHEAHCLEACGAEFLRVPLWS